MKRKRLERGSAGVIVGIVIVIVLLIGVGIFFVLSRQTSSQQDTSAIGTNQPQMKVTDYSGGVPENQTTAVVVQHSDSSFERYILSNAMAGDFVKKLPEGDKVISQTPLGQ